MNLLCSESIKWYNRHKSGLLKQSPCTMREDWYVRTFIDIHGLSLFSYSYRGKCMYHGLFSLFIAIAHVYSEIKAT